MTVTTAPPPLVSASDRRPADGAGPAPRAIVFAGGGTGGHIFPSLALLESLAALGPVRAVFLCSDRAVDASVLGPTGHEFHALPARPFGLRPVTLCKFMWRWGQALAQARAVLRDQLRLGGTVHLVATGGFVAAPAVRAAIVERVPVTLINVDAVPGKASRLIARRAARAFTTFPVAGGGGAPAPGWTVVPPIVRRAATARTSPAECRLGLGLSPDAPTLMVTGGSLGAASLNALMLELARERPELLRGRQVLHQAGAARRDQHAPDQVPALRAAYAAAGARAVVEPFTADMGLWWGAADVALSRAGAGAVAEAWANRVPTAFLPYPYHKDQHQRFNAAALVDAGAALLLDDLIDPRANLHRHGPALARLLNDPSARADMLAALSRLGPADGADRVARALWNL